MTNYESLNKSYPSGNHVIVHKKSFKKFNIKKWPGSKYEGELCLNNLCYLTDKEEIFPDDRVSLKLQKKISDWSLTEMMFSTLAFNYQGQILSFLDWAKLLHLLLHPLLSFSLSSFLKENQFNEVEQRNEVIFRARHLFEIYIILYLNEKSLKNLFDFLRIDLSISSTLISKTLLKDNFIDILKFLEEESCIILPSSEKTN